MQLFFVLALLWTTVFPLTTRGSEVQVLTAMNQEDVLGQSKELLIAFTAPWCRHCKELLPVYERLASDLEDELVVAKCDATEERALAARFDVKAYPAIFHLTQSREVRKYDGRRSLEDLRYFVDSGWREQAKLPLWSSPFGPIGRAKGGAIWLGTSAFRLHALLLEQGYSPAAALFICGGLGLVLIMLLVFLLATCGGESEHEHSG